MARSLSDFAQGLRGLSRVLALRIVEAAAPVLTDLAKQSFDAGETPYGVGWKPGDHGQKITLKQTGALARYIKYVAIGTKLRVALGVKYAKYQVGRRPVFPRQGGDLPKPYVDALKSITMRLAREALGR